MSSTNLSFWTTTILSAATAVSIFNGKPLSESFLIGVIRISMIDQMSQLVDQDIVQLKVASRSFGPNQPPDVRAGCSHLPPNILDSMTSERGGGR